MGNELKTLKDLSKTTIMVPDINSKRPCDSLCVPKVHIEEDEVKGMNAGWINHFEDKIKEYENLSEPEERIRAIQDEKIRINLLKIIFNSEEEIDGKD